MPSRLCPYCRRLIPAADFDRHKRRLHTGRQTPKWLKRQVLARDHHRCTVCGSTAALEVHHIDDDPSNDALSNLTTRCRAHNPRGSAFWYAQPDRLLPAIPAANVAERPRG